MTMIHRLSYEPTALQHTSREGLSPPVAFWLVFPLNSSTCPPQYPQDTLLDCTLFANDCVSDKMGSTSFRVDEKAV